MDAIVVNLGEHRNWAIFWHVCLPSGHRKNVDGEWLTALPDTASMLLEEEVEFIILASDGLWDWLKRYEPSSHERYTFTCMSSLSSWSYQNLDWLNFSCCVMSSADAVAFVRKRLQKHGDVQVNSTVVNTSLSDSGDMNIINLDDPVSQNQKNVSSASHLTSFYLFLFLCSWCSVYLKKLHKKLWLVAKHLNS